MILRIYGHLLLIGQTLLPLVDGKCTNDQSCPLIVSEVIPEPIVEGDQLVSKTNQIQNVDKHPDEPGEESFDVKSAGHIHYRLVPTYGSHGAFVQVFELF